MDGAGEAKAEGEGSRLCQGASTQDVARGLFGPLFVVPLVLIVILVGGTAGMALALDFSVGAPSGPVSSSRLMYW